MSKLKPYIEYQNVEYDYVSELPEDWELLPNLAIFQERIERGFVDEELLSVTIGRGVIRQADVSIKKDSSNQDKSKYKLIMIGDIAYNRMRMWQGALGYSHFRGITSPAYVILKPKMEINPRFFHYMFRAEFYTNYSKRFSYGIVDDQLSLRYTDFKRMYSIVPPLGTQNEIVSYLNRKTQQIQKFIQKKGRLIDLLEEEKERLISKTVTLGINDIIDFRSVKDNWIDKIPSHWEWKPLKRYVKLNIESISEKTNPKYLIKYVDIGNVTFKGLLENPEQMLFEKAPSRARRIVRSGDTILSTVRTYLKAIAYFEYADKNLIASTGFAILSPLKHITPKYLKYLLSSTYFLSKVSFWSIGVNYPSINNDRLMAIKLAVPPSITEQNKIINFIENELNKFNDTISKATLEIEKAKEYRDSLITQVVTGKLKVPDPAQAAILN